MNLVEFAGDTAVEYSPSSDELMLKELERRDGIYSFIFHELESGKEGGSSYLVEKTNGNLSSGYNHNQFIIYKVDECETQGTMKSPVDIKTENTAEPAAPPPPTATSPLPLINTETLASYNGDITKNSSAELWKTWHPPFAASSSSCYLLDQPKLYNYLSSGSFRIRMATPSFSHVSVPLVRNRRHTLKDTPEYKSSMSVGYIPDLRSLFPYDPDVHAPFKKVPVVGESQNVVEANEVRQ